MKKIVFSLIIIVSIFNIGCSSSDSVELVKENSFRIDTMPTWISNPPTSDATYFVTSNAKEENFYRSILEAEKDSKHLISKWIDIKVNNVIDKYTDQINAENYDNIEMFKLYTSQVSKSILSFANREQLYRANDETVYILMRVRKSDIRKAFDRANSTVSLNFSKPTESQLLDQDMVEEFKTQLLNDVDIMSINL